MKLDEYLKGTDNTVFYDQSFRNVLEDFIPYILNQKSTQKRLVDPSLAYRFEFDFYGLLAHYSIDYHLHWLIMRLAGLTAPNQATRHLSVIHLPSIQLLEALRSNHVSTNRIS